MQQLTFVEADALEQYYQFLLSFSIKAKRIKVVIKQPHDKNEEKYKVVVGIETDKPVIDAFQDLDDFCETYGVPYPPPKPC